MCSSSFFLLDVYHFGYIGIDGLRPDCPLPHPLSPNVCKGFIVHGSTHRNAPASHRSGVWPHKALRADCLRRRRPYAPMPSCQTRPTANESMPLRGRSR